MLVMDMEGAMKFFDYDGPLAAAIRDISNMILLNICFCLCCLPVVSAGAAIAALYSVYLNHNDDVSPVRRYFAAFRSNFAQATKIWLLVLAAGLLLGLELFVTFTLAFPGRVFVKTVLILAGAYYLSVSAYAFALQAHYENTCIQTVRNAMVLGGAGIINGILANIISFFPVIVFFAAIDLMPFVLSFWLPLGASLSTRLNAMLLGGVFAQVDALNEAGEKESDMHGHV